jgi:hypothetical protein
VLTDNEWLVIKSCLLLWFACVVGCTPPLVLHHVLMVLLDSLVTD